MSGTGGHPAVTGTGSGGAVQAVDPGTKGMHRLNAAEYNNTVVDVLGTTLQPANSSWRGGELAGFDNIASVLGVDEAQYQRYSDAAQALATEVMASDKLRGRFISCDLTDPACVTSSLERAGLRILRRPLAADERQTYQRVYDSARGAGDDEPTAFTLVLQTLLSSADFLFRIEVDPDPASTIVHPLGPFELASRLSYFLWSSAPDDDLLDAASHGGLVGSSALSATVDRMLADPKAERFVTNFAGQWLGAREVLAQPDFLQWSKQTAQAASQEILLYFSDFLHSGRSWFEFPRADINFVDGPLAYFYGIPSQQMEVGVFERVEYHDDARAGYLGLAGFLAVTSIDRRTSPSRRGRWIAGTLLCKEPPPPPPNIPMLDGDPSDADGGVATFDVRKRLEQHRQNPNCFGCHSLFDSYGLALEHYDAFGLFRADYGDGTPIDTAVVLPPPPSQRDGLAVDGLDGLSAAISSDPSFGSCLAQKLLTYGLGRTMTGSDNGHLQQAVQQWLEPGQTPSVGRLIHALVSTPAFLERRGGDQGSAQP
jgi:Protein of unknown function (DUF1592)/Protein of unknown function (DUF1588)/Protein of unknown function (DUF1587)/Protein of unknown function (DUF1595)/Protein of unknown function (DUF1585)